MTLLDQETSSTNRKRRLPVRSVPAFTRLVHLFDSVGPSIRLYSVGPSIRLGWSTYSTPDGTSSTTRKRRLPVRSVPTHTRLVHLFDQFIPRIHTLLVHLHSFGPFVLCWSIYTLLVHLDLVDDQEAEAPRAERARLRQLQERLRVANHNLPRVCVCACVKV